MHSSKFLTICILLPFTVKKGAGGDVPPQRLQFWASYALMVGCGALAPIAGVKLDESITCNQETMVVGQPHAPLWVRHADVDSTHQTLMGD